MPHASLTAETLRGLLHYDPESGVFTWLRRPERTKYDRAWNTRYAGRQAGTSSWRGGKQYRAIVIFNRRPYLSHRLAFLYMTGGWPSNDIDHRNGDSLNNRWGNLREATAAENNRNRKPRRHSTDLKGVSRYRDGRFMAQIRVAGRPRFLGYFNTPEEAHASYAAAAHEHHGDFARTS